ncbi:hypothetical protein ACFLUV_01860 [Elusimicrobiota bacterium]
MKNIIKLNLIFLLLTILLSKAEAHITRPIFIDSVIKISQFSITYENYYNPSGFFYGLKKNAYFNNYMVGLLKKTAGGIQYDFVLGKGKMEIGKRESDPADGLVGHIGISKDIWGDLVVFPVWKWYIGLTGARYDLTDYIGEDIDIKYSYLCADVSLSCSKRWNRFIPYAGVDFFLKSEKYREKTTQSSHSSEGSGLSPFAGCRIKTLERIFIHGQVNFIDKAGYMGSMEFVF